MLAEPGTARAPRARKMIAHDFNRGWSGTRIRVPRGRHRALLPPFANPGRKGGTPSLQLIKPITGREERLTGRDDNLRDQLPPHYLELVADAALKSYWRRKALWTFLRRCGFQSHSSQRG